MAATLFIGRGLHPAGCNPAPPLRQGRPVARVKRRAEVTLALVALVWASIAGGCSEPDFEETWEVKRLRLLAVQVEPPEVGPGESVTLRALVVQPGSGVPQLRWQLCLAVDRSLPDAPCVGVPLDGGDAVDVLWEGEGAEIAFTSPLSGAEVEVLCEALRTFRAESCALGLPLVWRLEAAGAADQRLVATRELLLLTEAAAARDDRNRNPTLGPLLIGDQPITEADGSVTIVWDGASDIELAFETDTSASQVYDDPRSPGERRREELRASWFVEEGELERSVTYFAEGIAALDELTSNLWSTTSRRPLPTDQELRLWVVLRDSRNGVAWREARIRLTVPR